jgi:outer membrane immunogenic protein
MLRGELSPFELSMWLVPQREGRMRKALGLVGATLLFAGPAVAADLAVKAPTYAPAASWSGCYAGVNGGWIGGKSNYDLNPSGNYLNAPGVLAPPNINGTGNFAVDNAALSHSYSSSPSSGEIGAQVGCNQQFGQFVLGFEADWQWSGLSDNINASYGAFANLGNPGFTDAAHSEHVSSKLDWFSTFRGRFGFTLTPNVLVFGTAGLVLADVKSDTAVNFATLAGASVFNGASHIGSANQVLPGGVVGGGVEWAFAPNWSVKAEYLYFKLSDLSYSSPLVAAAVPFSAGYSWNTKVRMDESVARVGLNFHF